MLAKVRTSGQHYLTPCQISLRGPDPMPMPEQFTDLAKRVNNSGPIIGRGILLDIPRALGLDKLGDAEHGHALTPADLDAAVDMAGLSILPGDIVLIRTGAMRSLKAGDKLAYAYPTSGPSMQT